MSSEKKKDLGNPSRSDLQKRKKEGGERERERNLKTNKTKFTVHVKELQRSHEQRYSMRLCL